MNTPPIKIKLRSLRSRKNTSNFFSRSLRERENASKKFLPTTSTQNRCISRPVHKSDPEPKSARTYTRVIGLMHGSWGSDLCTGGGGVGTIYSWIGFLVLFFYCLGCRVVYPRTLGGLNKMVHKKNRKKFSKDVSNHNLLIESKKKKKNTGCLRS